MSEIESLEPKGLWHFFAEICKVPRPSLHEEQISAFLRAFGEQHHLETIADAKGNVIIRKPASKGFESRPMLLLQAHMDMVAEKNRDVCHDFLKDPIIPYIKEGWVWAKGTTLGADDGIGVACALAILDDDSIQHGPLECLFTVDEEKGMTGADAIQPGVLKSRVMVNLDSEQDGDFCIGCAGGIDTTAAFDYKWVPSPQNFYFFKVEIKGLQGGHSGEDIHKNRGNAVFLLTRFLYQLGADVQLAAIDGGNLRNALAREASAIVGVPFAQKEQARVLANIFLSQLQNEYKNEPSLSLLVESVVTPTSVFNSDIVLPLINSLMACPHGVYGMSSEIEGLVETSTNLASVKMDTEKSQIIITTSQRSSVESRLTEISSKVESVFRLAGAHVSHGGAYPGWEPNFNSKIKDVVVSAYVRLFNQQPLVRAIHAGVECGLFFKKYPDLDMISLGPTMIGIHSPNEHIEIEAVSRFWKLMMEVLVNVK